MGRLLYRLTAAVALAAGATAIDRPRTLDDASRPRDAAPRRVRREGPIADRLTLAPGMHAMTFEIVDATGDSELFRPDDRVDMLLMRSVPAPAGPATEVLQRNLRVLAVATVGRHGIDGRPVRVVYATLEVAGSDMKRLRFAPGSIRLVRHVRR